MKNPSGKGERLIITHCGNEQGFVDGAGEVFRAWKGTGDYHQEMDGPHYEKWFSEKPLPKLAPNSVIVMDNAPYYSVKIEKVPRMSTRKKDIQDWLFRKGVAWSNEMVKAELLQLVAKVEIQGNQYRVDQMASLAGHTVLRLPSYHCQLNPIELVWSMMKGYVADKNKTFKFADLKPLVLGGFAEVTPEKWAHCVRHVMEEEDTMRKVDHIIDDVVDSADRILINLGDEDSERSEDDSPEYASMSDDDLGCQPL